jgi:mitochondrial import inner membrane translocase subunit TIM21
MFLHFYIQGSRPGTKITDASEGYLDSMVHWTSDGLSRLSDMSFDDVVDGARARAAGVAESSKALFKFLSGESTSTPSTNQPPVREPAPVEKEPSSVWSFAGLFSGIKGKRYGDGLSVADDRVFLEGEAHAELIRNDQGYFDFKDLIVEIPSTFFLHMRVAVQVLTATQIRMHRTAYKSP